MHFTTLTHRRQKGLLYYGSRRLHRSGHDFNPTTRIPVISVSPGRESELPRSKSVPIMVRTKQAVGSMGQLLITLVKTRWKNFRVIGD